MGEANAPVDNVIAYRGERFIKTTWNGISVLKHERTGYYKASKACEDNKKRFNNWRRNKETQEYLEFAAEDMGVAIEGIWNSVTDARIRASVNPGCLLYRIASGGNVEDLSAANEASGYYIHPNLFHGVCYWSNKRYAYLVDRLMNLINERNKLKHQTLEQTIEKLENQLIDLEIENIGLKDDNENKNRILDDLEAELVSRAAKIDELESEIVDLTTPVDPRGGPPTVYAKAIGEDHFQLKQSKTVLGPNISTLRRESFVGADEACFQTKKELKKLGLATRVNGKLLVRNADLDTVFDVVHRIKARMEQVVSIDERNEWLDQELAKQRSYHQTPQVIGKTFELELIKQSENLIPWGMVPDHIRNELNEMKKDTGIDAVIFDGNQISEIIQIKHHKDNAKLRSCEIAPFLEKATQPRYANIRKRLIVNNCEIGPRLRKSITAKGVVINEALIND